MIDGKRVLGLIAARGGSKGLPGKNVADLAGLPLIAWTIRAAQAAATLDRLVLTSDDADIIRTAREFGCEVPFVRPPDLAQDETRIEPVVLHALDALGEEYDYVVLLYPTVPLRTPADIDGSVTLCARSGAPACVTVSEPGKTPYWMFHVDEDDRRMRPVIDLGRIVPRRQELPKVYVLNGAVFVADTARFRTSPSFFQPDTVAYAMPAERSVDIDGPLDLLFARVLIEARG
ncbi:acylneuraminate cytidylyltransferase family protein (plasmid) [Azospirillum sp. TSA2s]|uniref:acylneuraminate cytidylyltransferase family protein n=1 Tax=Azospirillum sp. TSA2s TaxID=709810 RepID=UPI0010AA64B8|nr:acylneuraminate cytidylyltransferase family protein [Azospirillum sp. TSA2s]QCG93044.1 acylneuraminate cytidylyltransferase family protein [Azospirillum sp. TSA2s]